MLDPGRIEEVTPAIPLIRPVGLSGLLVTFGTRLSSEANYSALAFRGALETLGREGLIETSTTLVSTFLSYDPTRLPLAELQSMVEGLLAGRDWTREPLPPGRRLWRIPTSFGGANGPQLAEVADFAGLTETAAISQIEAVRVRVLAIGFAPGMPYLGTLPENWDIPRQTRLSQQVPAGAVVTAIRQMNIFTNATPTGWRQIGQTAFRNFRPKLEQPFALRPGDEVQLTSASAREVARLAALDGPDNGGAICEELP